MSVGTEEIIDPKAAENAAEAERLAHIQKMEEAAVRSPTVVIGFTRSGNLNVNVIQGNSIQDAVVMMQQMINELLGAIKYTAETESLVKPVPAGALQGIGRRR